MACPPGHVTGGNRNEHFRSPEVPSWQVLSARFAQTCSSIKQGRRMAMGAAAQGTLRTSPAPRWTAISHCGGAPPDDAPRGPPDAVEVQLHRLRRRLRLARLDGRGDPPVIEP